MKTRQLLRIMFLSLAIVLAACGADEEAESEMDNMEMESDDMQMGMDDIPAELDTSTTRMTEDERFVVTVTSELEPLTINQIHNWRVHVETPDGQPVDAAEITIDGGMPQHNHGFPTVPEITDFLGDGDYLVEGVRFNMPGWWEMKFEIGADGEQDAVTFNILME
jgi:hypothetical protein